MASSARHEIVVEPDYGQFYLRREGAEWQSDEVPSAGFERHLWSSGTFVMVGTVRRYGPTPLEIEVRDSAPETPTDDVWQHVVEESLAPGGDLEIFNWADDAVGSVPIPHGPVRLRVSWAGLDEANTWQGMDDEGNSSEHIRVQIWLDKVAPPSVLRCWPPLNLPAPTDRSPDGRRQIEGLEAVLAHWDHLELVSRFSYPYPPLPGSARAHSTTTAVYRDRRDGTLWADGDDIRRTLREIDRDEATELQRRDTENYEP